MLYTLNGARLRSGEKAATLPANITCYQRSRRAVVSFRFGKPDPLVSVVIAYGPTTPRCTANPQLKEDFYQLLQAAVDTIPKMV